MHCADRLGVFSIDITVVGFALYERALFARLGAKYGHDRLSAADLLSELHLHYFWKKNAKLRMSKTNKLWVYASHKKGNVVKRTP
jgi:hypothetical protein